MPLLSLDLLGPLHVTLEGVAVPFRSDKERALLAFLAVEADRPHRREALTGLLYPDQAQIQAQNNLRKTLFRLRAALGEQDDNAGLLLISQKTVQFNPAGPHTLDVEQFRALLTRARQHKHRRAETCATCAAQLASACAIYRGEFLAGFNRSGSDTFEEWAVLVRERLHQDALDALEQLVAFYETRGMWEQVIVTARRVIELEVWRESAHRALMRAHATQGQRAAAFAQYETCKKVLAEQFDAAPERATVTLYESIRSGNFVPIQPPISNIQHPVTPLIGRAREIETLTARLLNPAQRLLTIVGPGGMGKTRLALAATERVRHDFQQGAFFVGLAGIHPDTAHTNDAIAAAAADALGITFGGTIAPARQLQNYLRAQELLLVFDNFEHLMSSAAWLVELVTAAPRVTLLITSREPLNVRAETVLRLEGLDVPKAGSAQNVRESDSVQLFVERAARAAGQFTVNADTLKRVSGICEQVEGMPLAIELAAAWMRTRTLDEIARQIETNVDFLTTTQRDVPSRHASMRAVWDGSWELLSEHERNILMQLSIFRSNIEQNAVISIISAQLNDLDTLVNKSLLRRAEEGIYELHELLKQFAGEKLAAARDNMAVVRRYNAYFLEFGAVRGAAFERGDPQIPLQELRRELDNLRAAWSGALEQNQLELIYTHAYNISKFFYLTGLFREGLALIENALARSVEGIPNDALQMLRAEFLERLARYEEASGIIETLLAQPDLDLTLIARAYLRAAWIDYWTGHLVQGRAHAQRTVSAAIAKHAPTLLADALYVAGLIEQSSADTTAARSYYQHALGLYRAQHNRYGECSALVNLADIGVDDNALDDALEFGEKALALATQIGKRFDQAAAHIILGSLSYTLDEPQQSASHYASSLRLFREMGNGTGECIALRDLGMAAYQRGDAAQAQHYATEALRVAQEVGSIYREGLAQTTLGQAYWLAGRVTEAERAFLRALELLTNAERGHLALDALAGLVRVAQARGDAPLARERLDELLARFQEQTFYDSDEPSAIYLLCVQALEQYNDPRAEVVLERGIQELEARAARIRNDALRHQFLEQHPAHRALRQASQRRKQP